MTKFIKSKQHRRLEFLFAIDTRIDYSTWHSEKTPLSSQNCTYTRLDKITAIATFVTPK